MPTSNPLKAALIGAALVSLVACSSPEFGTVPHPNVPSLTLNWSIKEPSFGSIFLRNNLLFGGKSVRAMNLDTHKFAFSYPIDKTRPYNTDVTLRNYVPFNQNFIVQSYEDDREYIKIINVNGDVINTITLPDGIPAAGGETGPMLTENALYTSSGPILYKYNRSDLLSPNAKPVWTKKYQKFNLASFYALDDNHIFLEPNDGKNQVFVLGGDGNQQWMAQINSPDLIVGQSFVMHPYKNTLIIEAGTTGLMALDMDTGKMVWDKPASINVCPLTGTTSNQITIADDKIFVGPWAGSCLQAYHADTGKLAWVFESPNRITFNTTPLYHNGVIYATNSIMFALDANTGKLLAQGDQYLNENVGTPIVYDPVRNEILQWGLTGLFAYKLIK